MGKRFGGLSHQRLVFSSDIIGSGMLSITEAWQNLKVKFKGMQRLLTLLNIYIFFSYFNFFLSYRLFYFYLFLSLCPISTWLLLTYSYFFVNYILYLSLSPIFCSIFYVLFFSTLVLFLFCPFFVLYYNFIDLSSLFLF
jgi:hypothetical protein